MNAQPDEAQTMTFADAATFETWLAKNYDLQAGVWVKVAKVSSGIPSVTSDELVDVGLCWGWISGLRKSYDESYYLQKYVPRRKRSVWSQVNVDKVMELTAAGKMQPSGLAEVEAAKADGRWKAAYVSQKNATIPADLQAALAQNKKAQESFGKLNKTEKYEIVLHLALKRTPKGKQAFLEKTVEQLELR
jgi:uncharacterized protein YdeI (YjbR/CyaY-like superfamily)